jgi:hypothetical protein
MLCVQIGSFHGRNFLRVFFSFFSELFLSVFGQVGNIFFMLSASYSCLLSLLRFGSGDGELSPFSGCAAGLPSYLLGVQWVSLILMLASSSSVRMLP